MTPVKVDAMKITPKSISLSSSAAPFAIRAERAGDVAARETLLDACFGSNRHLRTCQRLRDGRMPSHGLAFTATHRGALIGTVRLWDADAGGCRALVLRPLAVDPHSRALGVGAALMRHALGKAKRLGHGAVVLLGDAPYYARFGFSAELAAKLALPGPFERERLLGLEFTQGALGGANGLIVATGAWSEAMLAAPARAAA